MKRNFKQMIMSNGDEIICEILAQQDDEIIARKALRVISYEMSPSAIYYSFKPWMLLKDDLFDPISINAFHTIGMCVPEKKMMKNYKYALKGIIATHKEEQETEEMAKYETFSEVNEEVLEEDEETNVVPLFDRDKLH